MASEPETVVLFPVLSAALSFPLSASQDKSRWTSLIVLSMLKGISV